MDPRKIILCAGRVRRGEVLLQHKPTEHRIPVDQTYTIGGIYI